MNGKNDISSRFLMAYQRLLDDGKVSDKKDFAASIGISSSMMTEIAKGRSSVGTTAIQNIVLNHNVAPDWLLTGHGPMLRSDNVIPEDDTEELQRKPIISYNPSVGAPYFDVDFVAGFDLVEADQTIIPTANIVVYGFERAKLWCNVTGNSMWPKLNHGDRMGLNECTINDIQYGEMYAVVLDTLRTIKILRKSADPTKLRFIPINTKEYDEQEFEISRILKIYEVVGSISRFM